MAIPAASTVPATTSNFAKDVEVTSLITAVRALLGVFVSSLLSVTAGGTGLGGFTSGDMLYASAANTLSALAKAAANGALLYQSGGFPAWLAAATNGQLLALVSGAPAWAGDTAWTAPTLVGTWANSGGGNQTAGYFFDASGFLHLRGLVTGGTVNTQIFVLPVGRRPSANMTFPGAANGVPNGEIVVTSAGSVQQQGSASATNTSLDGITFDTR